MPLRSIWRGTTAKWDSARSALKAIPGANVNDVDLCKNRTFCCGSGGGCFWKEEEKNTTRINHMRFDQIAMANPETLAVGCPFLHDDDGGRGQIPLTGGKTAHPRFVGIDRRIYDRANEMIRDFPRTIK